MDTGFSADEVVNEDRNSIFISSVAPDHENCGTVKPEAVVVLLSQSSASLAVSRTPCKCPETPDADRESIVQNRDLLSPLTSAASPPNIPCLNATQSSGQPTSPNGDCSVTPKHSIFDSFAPGPEKSRLAPHRSRCMRESRVHVARQLDFGCTTDLDNDIDYETNGETIPDEEHILEHIHCTVLDTIFSEQVKELVCKSPQTSDSDGLKTPKFAPNVSRVAYTCPGAPRKSATKFRYIDRGICRKLEF